MHGPPSDALVITTRIANNNVYKMLVDNGNVIDIIYLDAYKRMRLNEGDLSLTTTPLYGFTRDHIILKCTIKLAVIVEEHPRVSTVMIEFLIIDCPSAFNGVIGRHLLKVLKAITSIYHHVMKFPTTEGITQIRGSQCDSRESYNKSSMTQESVITSLLSSQRKRKNYLK